MADHDESIVRHLDFTISEALNAIGLHGADYVLLLALKAQPAVAAVNIITDTQPERAADIIEAACKQTRPDGHDDGQA